MPRTIEGLLAAHTAAARREGVNEMIDLHPGQVWLLPIGKCTITHKFKDANGFSTVWWEDDKGQFSFDCETYFYEWITRKGAKLQPEQD